MSSSTAGAAGRPEILLFQRIADNGMALLEANFAVHHLWSADEPEALLRDAGPRVRGVLTGAARGIAPELVETLPRLEIISLHGVGLDRIDLGHARSRGLRVAYTPDVLVDDVADMAMMLMLGVLRQMPRIDRYVRDGSWERGLPLSLGTRTSGKRLGVLGLGRIGGAAAARAAAFGMEVAYHNRWPRAGIAYRYEPDPVALARWCDVLLLAASTEPGGGPLVDERMLQALGPEGFLVNVGRGALVDEAALIAALREGRLAGAGLDVYVDEPRVPEALRVLDNVVLAPHWASATRETRAAMAEQSVRHLIDHFAGREPAKLAT